MWELRIELLGPLCAASGLGQAGYADRDVVFDADGLPYLPGRRLKGLLRDAYRELEDCPALNDLKPAGEVFGQPGAETAGGVHAGNAVVERAQSLRAWLRGQKGSISRQDVIEFFTEMRRQTAISRETGAAEENTLRATRLIRAGRVFVAPIEGVPTGCEQALEMAARALQFMGVGRTRGWGRVACTLQEAVGPGAIVPPADPASAGKPERGEECLLPFTMELTRAALCPTLAGDPNSVRTEEYIPGSAVHGMLARRYLAIHGANPRFFELFCSGRVRFLAATFLLPHEDGGGVRSLHVPHSIRELKSAEGCFVNLAHEHESDQPLRRVAGWTVPGTLFGEAAASRAEVHTEIHYHHARPADPRIGHAVGDRYKEFGLEREKAGALFTYQSLSAEQRFGGAVLGSAADLEEIRELIQDGETGIRVGRSKSAQYGGEACWRFGEIRDSRKVGREADGWGSGPSADLQGQDDRQAGRIIVTLLSDLVARNEHGHPAAVFPEKELEEALEVKFGAAGKRAYARTAWSGGYLAHQRLPRQQTLCLRAGSVFVFPLAEPVNLSQLRGGLADAERRSWGMRVEEGFGRVALDLEVADPGEGLRLEDAPSARTGSAQPPPRGSLEYELALGVYKRRIEEHARQEALQLGAAIDGKYLTRVSNHALARLLAIVEGHPLGQAAGQLEAIRKTVAGKLGRFWIAEGNEQANLQEFLVRRCREWEQTYKGLEYDVYDDSKAPWAKLFPREHRPNLGPVFHERVVRLYLKHFLRSLLWRKRADLVKTARREEGEPA